MSLFENIKDEITDIEIGPKNMTMTMHLKNGELIMVLGKQTVIKLIGILDGKS